MKGFLVALGSLFLAACGDQKPLAVVDHVDLQRYTGTWYEIARLPQWFQRGCYDSKAEYHLMDDGRLAVTNTCLKQRGGDARAEGVARVVDHRTNARLKVRFHNWFSNLLPRLTEGDYWIIDLGGNYETAMVGAPNRKYLWILARTPQLPDDEYRALVDKAAGLGFPVKDLLRNRDLRPHSQ